MALQNNKNLETVVKKNPEDEEAAAQSFNVETNLLAETRKKIKWWVFLLNCAMMMAGTIGGPLMTRFYFQHGGSRKWIPTWLQSAGFPVLFIPLIILYYRKKNRSQSETESEPIVWFAGVKLLFISACLGLLLGVDNFMYSTGLSYLPLTTQTLLFATQLAFTAIFALIIVKQKFTPFSINAVVLMTLASVLLGLTGGNDRPTNVSLGHYLLGFFLTLGAAAVVGLYFPLIELAYAKGAGNRRITYIIVTQVQIAGGLAATIFSTIGMLANHDFQAIPREAKTFGLGEGKYYMILVLAAICFQILAIGALGVIFCASSLMCGILNTAMIPVTEVVAAIVFKEKFTGQKGMSLALCLWGVTSYFYGEYRMTKKMKEKLKATVTASDSSPRAEPGFHSV